MIVRTLRQRLVKESAIIHPNLAMCQLQARHFSRKSIVTPPAKLQFINHPRHGKVYPVVAYGFDRDHFQLPLFGIVGVSALNSLVSYAVFIDYLIFTPTASSILCNPLFVIPLYYLNYQLIQKYYVNFFGKRAQVQNIYMKPNGREVIVETRDGNSVNVQNTSFYEPKQIRTRWDTRLDFGYGANIYLFMRGNPLIYDQLVLQGILENKQIDP